MSSQKLRKLIGSAYLYNGNVYAIQNAYMDGELIKLETDKGPLKMTEKEIDTLPEVPKSVMQLPAEMKQEFASCADTAAIIKDTITKVQGNPGYVPQAREINAAVKNLIDLKRVQVEMIHLLKS